MNGRSYTWIPWLVSICLIFGGIIAAARKEYMLSGSFALYFIGYSIIRASSLLRRPNMQISPALRLLGFALVITATFFFFYWYLVIRT